MCTVAVLGCLLQLLPELPVECDIDLPLLPGVELHCLGQREQQLSQRGSIVACGEACQELQQLRSRPVLGMPPGDRGWNPGVLRHTLAVTSADPPAVSPKG